jgi:hypothetical protein
MKEIPIFNAEMVRAILDGRKTVTRRPVKPQPNHRYHDITLENGVLKSYTQIAGVWNVAAKVKCPYGQPGDRLWVRETWAIKDCGNRVKITAGEFTMRHRLQYPATDKAPHADYWWNKRPSINMPRWASRITLEVLSVRVEMVQEISEEDAKAEGIIAIRPDIWPRPERAHIEAFSQTWDEIYGKTFPWSSNPWVWVVEFRRWLPGGIHGK